MDRSAQLESTAAPSEQKAQSNNSRLTRPERHRLPTERRAITHHFSVGGQEGYLTVGLYEDGVPGELFLKMSKEGSTVSGLMDSFATAVSLALQYGVPLSVLCRKFSHMRFEPSGWTGNPDIGYAKSIMDYIFRWLALRFLAAESENLFGTSALGSGVGPNADPVQALAEIVRVGDGPPCPNCGSLMVRNGSCHRCLTCGSTSGCS